MCLFPDGKVLTVKFLGQRAGKFSKFLYVYSEFGQDSFFYNFPTNKLLPGARKAERSLPRRRGLLYYQIVPLILPLRSKVQFSPPKSNSRVVLGNWKTSKTLQFLS